MLKQIVYTRCRPHRRITDGAISPTEGFGVYSFSKELVGSSDANFIESRLAIQSAAKENTPSGLFNSYEYYHLSDGQDFLIRDVALPLCTVPRKSGAGHRSGNFLRQGLIGHIDWYPYQWFESSNFDAANHDQNYYYDDSQQPTAPFLPLVQNSPYGGKISDLKLSMFISSRRAALEGAVSFLYGEMAKPEADRKVLLIKDSPENVMYWVAAIEHSFPLDWAKDITFATNRSLMGSQIERNLFSGSMGSSSVGEARKPYAMIVGYLPSSPALPHYPTSPYAILDGSAKNIVASEKRLSDKFVSFLVNAGSARDYFFSSLIANAKLAHFDLGIPSLYDSYCIVSDVLDGRNGVGIEALARALDNLSAYALDGAFTAKAVSKLAAIYPACLEQDRKAGFALFSNIEKFARSAGLNAGLSEIFFAELTKGIAEPSLYGASLPSCVEAMASIGILDAALHRLSPYFRDDRFRALTNKLAGLPSEYLLSILDLFVKTKVNGRLPSGDVAQNADDFNFLWRIVFELVPKGKERKAFEIIGSAAANQRIFFHLYPFYLKQNSPYASRFLDSYLAECHLTKEEIIISCLKGNSLRSMRRKSDWSRWWGNRAPISPP